MQAYASTTATTVTFYKTTDCSGGALTLNLAANSKGGYSDLALQWGWAFAIRSFKVSY